MQASLLDSLPELPHGWTLRQSLGKKVFAKSPLSTQRHGSGKSSTRLGMWQTDQEFMLPALPSMLRRDMPRWSALPGRARGHCRHLTMPCFVLRLSYTTQSRQQLIGSQVRHSNFCEACRRSILLLCWINMNRKAAEAMQVSSRDGQEGGGCRAHWYRPVGLFSWGLSCALPLRRPPLSVSHIRL